MLAEVVMTEQLSSLLKESRIEKGYSEEELGEMLGVSHAAVSHWESGKQVPRDRQLRRLSQILELDLGDLLHMAEEERCRKEFRKLKAKYGKKYVTILLRNAAKELNQN